MPERNPYLCMTYGSNLHDEIRLHDCNDNGYDGHQRIAEFDYGGKFQLRPEEDLGKDSDRSFCFTNEHHPRSNEVIQLTRCRTAEENDPGVKDDTSHWVAGHFND